MALGATTTLVADRLRWRRESRERHEVSKKSSYTSYLIALAAWRNGLRETAYNPGLAAEDRRAHARQALVDSQAYERRMEMLITASKDVVRESEATYKALRNMKDPIADGLLQDHPEYRTLVASFEARLQRLRASMRADLNIQDPEAGIGFPGIIPE
ncbi:hypothetical protein [Streptomyces sp. YIM 130001]|uniref:hypothetical protein n=1 Tax=Streptomyces sp. YIM 130001 TaxID=2259644 RepID=UPI0013C481D3|nr:hypothetical protein [Streptomyces sp. YIM 130001]